MLNLLGARQSLGASALPHALSGPWGCLIDAPSLQHALKQGYISQAVLDVFDTEPLPPESPLWEHPDVIISPHISSVTLDFQVAKVFGDNFDRFVQEQPLKYLLDWSKGY